MADLAEVFHPDNGLLWKFYQAELKPFIVEGADGWEMRKWADMGLTLSEEFLNSLVHTRLLSESLFPKGSGDAGAVFELYPYPPQGGVKNVTEIRLEIGGQALRYRMEPQEWHEMKWPGPTPASGAILQVNVAGVWLTKEFKDWWGLFRMIQAGRQLVDSTSSVVLIMANTLTLYSGPHCHLCDQAKALLYPVLQESGWQLREVSIADNEDLQNLYGVRIPVVVTPDGREKGWPFTAGQIRRLLANP